MVVDAVAVTGSYLTAHAVEALQSTPAWSAMLRPPLRCYVPFEGSDVSCEPLLGTPTRVFDYPTTNPKYKRDGGYRWTYAIAPQTSSSRFDFKLGLQGRGLGGGGLGAGGCNAAAMPTV